VDRDEREPTLSEALAATLSGRVFTRTLPLMALHLVWGFRGLRRFFPEENDGASTPLAQARTTTQESCFGLILSFELPAIGEDHESLIP
jgi:hypothetical protein